MIKIEVFLNVEGMKTRNAENFSNLELNIIRIQVHVCISRLFLFCLILEGSYFPKIFGARNKHIFFNVLVEKYLQPSKKHTL